MLDEDLPQPPQREWPRLRRARRPAAAVLALAAVAAGAVALVQRDAGPGPRSDDALPVPVAHLPRSFHIEFPPLDVLPDAHVRIKTATGEVPAAVAAALRRALPDVQGITATSVIGGPGETTERVYYRQITARQGAVQYSIEITQRRTGQKSGTVVHRAGASIAVLQIRRAAGLAVSVSAVGPPGEQLDVRPLQRLAADSDLLALH